MIFTLILLSSFLFSPTYVVDDADGYNCWPMIQSVGDRIICVYTQGKEHNPSEKGRAVYARYSDDGAVSWSEKKLIFISPDCGTSSVGKGLDEDGSALFWIRRMGVEPRMALYRTADGENFELLSTPPLSPNVMQITDIFRIPNALMCLWFSDDYSTSSDNKSWGTLISRDNGRTWEQTVVEQSLSLSQWPTEPSVVVLGDGRLLAIARSEGEAESQFQLVSSDWGKTWKKFKTNIDDVHKSTPSLAYNAETGEIYNYYFHRGAGSLKLRRGIASELFDHSDCWGDPVIVSWGNLVRSYDSGNANSLSLGNKHYVAFYAGDPVNCKVLVSVVGGTMPENPMDGRRVLLLGSPVKNLAVDGKFRLEDFTMSEQGVRSQAENALKNIPAESVDLVVVNGPDWEYTDQVENLCKKFPNAKLALHRAIQAARPRIFLAAASICAAYPESRRPQWGYGEKLQKFLPDYEIVNFACSGRSTKSYIDEGRWNNLISQVQRGDYVFIEFAHNDEKKSDPSRYTEPYGSYYDNLCRFVADVRSKGATPVLISPVCRRRFDGNGVPVMTHGDYPAAMKKAAQDTDTAFIDLESMTDEWLRKLGDEQSKLRYLWTDTQKDNTHFQELGAEEVAEMICHDLKTARVL